MYSGASQDRAGEAPTTRRAMLTQGYVVAGKSKNARLYIGKKGATQDLLLRADVNASRWVEVSGSPHPDRVSACSGERAWQFRPELGCGRQNGIVARFVGIGPLEEASTVRLVHIAALASAAGGRPATETSPIGAVGSASPDALPSSRSAGARARCRQAQEKFTAAGRPQGTPVTQQKALRSSQEDLLKVVFQIECARAKAEPKPIETVVKRSPIKQQAEVVEVTAYYATNRNQTTSREPLKIYGADFEPMLRYGRAVVTIPLTHVTGNIELPKLWKLQRQPDPSKHFVLKSVVPMDKESVRREMLERLDATGNKAILLFVHGYYLTFPEAAMRTASLPLSQFAGLLPLQRPRPASALLRQDEETPSCRRGVREAWTTPSAATDIT